MIEAAARWYSRLQSPSCTPQDRDEFEQWLRVEPAHSQAYAAAQRLAEDVFEIVAADPRLRAMADEAFAMGAEADIRDTGVSRFRRRPRWGIPATLAAGIAAAVLVVGFSGLSLPPSATLARVATSDEQRELVLEDGTVVHVDVRSDLEVRLTSTERLVVLTRGRAIFDVAHDPERPFSVTAGPGRVTALGTRFEVRRTYEQTIITLAEGAVTVSGEIHGQPQSERLEPGDQLSIAPRRAEWVKRRVDPVAATSWSVGRHVFRDTRLADALDEVNVYAATKVRLADPALADLPVSGSFVSGDSASVVAAFAAVLPIRIADGGNELLLFQRREAQTD